VADGAARLLDAVRRLNESLDPSRVLVRVCEEAARLLDADNASVFLGSGDEGVRLAATYGGPAGLIGEVVGLDEPMPTDGGLAVPLRWEGRMRGILAVGFGSARAATRDELGLLEAFGDLAAAACRNASAHAELALAARTDMLTGCLNHAAMHDALHREFERARRTGHALSLVMIDLDEFKQVNERHGHLAGDELLRRVGESLRQSVRAYDLVARYGGDEFAVIAIDADEETATEVAARAVEAIGGAATAGVAEWEAGDSPTALIARADGALLHGKHQAGRGTAVRASSLPAGSGGG